MQHQRPLDFEGPLFLVEPDLVCARSSHLQGRIHHRDGRLARRSSRMAHCHGRNPSGQADPGRRRDRADAPDSHVACGELFVLGQHSGAVNPATTIISTGLSTALDVLCDALRCKLLPATGRIRIFDCAGVWANVRPADQGDSPLSRCSRKFRRRDTCDSQSTRSGT